jgi:hypothetical protein
MSFKPLDRIEVRTKDLMVEGQPHNQYHDPFALAARHMWADISSYQDIGISSDSLRVNIQRL